MVSPSGATLLALLDRAVDIIAVVDTAGRLTFVNSTVAAVLDRQPGELVGRPALELIHPDDLEMAAAGLALELAGSEDGLPVEVRIRHRLGHYLWFEVLGNGLLDGPDASGLVLNLRESTGRHRLAVLAARRAALDRLVFDVSRRALEATLADVTKALPSMLAELGELLGASNVYAELFEAGSTRLLDELPAMQELLGSGELVVADDIGADPPAWAREWYGRPPDLATCILYPMGAGGRLLGVLVIEATERREWSHDELNAVRSVGEALAVALVRDGDRRALVASEEQFRLIAENASDVITLLDEDGRCRYVSAAARTVLGVEPAALVGDDAFARVHEDDRQAAHDELASFVASGADSMAITYRWRRPSGDVIWIEDVVRAVRDPETGTLWGIEGSARDVTARQAREDELSHRALHDPLTGVANRTLFVERMAAAMRLRRRSGVPLAVLAIDLDDFKELNDLHGHLEGDRALVTVAERLSSAVRHGDTVGRVGGDEFLVLSLETTADDAMALARRLVELVTEPIPVVGGVARIGVSVGVAVADESDPTVDALLEAADQAMYDAKRAGKRGVRLRRPG
jgi:diguanylate cyclase (GGDEF)-like protein/PAS domain S-box-containing protein